MAQTVENLSAWGRPGLIPGLGRSPREGNGNYSNILPGDSMDRGGWQAIVHGVPKSWTQLGG